MLLFNTSIKYRQSLSTLSLGCSNPTFRRYGVQSCYGAVSFKGPATLLPFQLTEKKALEIATQERDKFLLMHYGDIDIKYHNDTRKNGITSFMTKPIHKQVAAKLLLPSYAYIASLLIHLQEVNSGRALTASVTLDQGFYPGNQSSPFRYLNPHPFDPEDWNAMYKKCIHFNHKINNSSSQFINRKDVRDIKILEFELNPPTHKSDFEFIKDCFMISNSTTGGLANISPSIKTAKYYYLLTAPKSHWKVYKWDIIQLKYIALYMPVYRVIFRDTILLPGNICKEVKTTFIVTADDKYSPRIYQFNNLMQHTNKFTNNSPFMDIIIEQQDNNDTTATTKRNEESNSKEHHMMNYDTMIWPVDYEQLSTKRASTSINNVINGYIQRTTLAQFQNKTLALN